MHQNSWKNAFFNFWNFYKSAKRAFNPRDILTLDPWDLILQIDKKWGYVGGGTPLSQQQASQVSNVSQKCVFDVSRKLKQDLLLSNSFEEDRTKATTPHDNRQLLRIMKKDRTKSSHVLSTEYLLSNSKKVSACTVRHHLISTCYKSYTGKWKSLRTPAQIKQRLIVAKEDHQLWLNEWNNVICSIETHSEVLNRKNGTFVRRLKSESNEASNFIPRVQGGGGGGGGSNVSVCDTCWEVLVVYLWFILEESTMLHISK